MVKLIAQKILYAMAKNQASHTENEKQDPTPVPASSSLAKNIKTIQFLTGKSEDIIFRQFTLSRLKSAAALIFINGLTDFRIINNNILQPLLSFGRTAVAVKRTGSAHPTERKFSMQDIADKILSANEITLSQNITDIISGLLCGNAILAIDGFDSLLIINCKGWDKRNIDVPSSESVIRGPRESFTENLITNTAMIRRKIKDQNLTVESTRIGTKTQTSVCLMYIKHLAHDELIETIRNRLKDIHTDSILESGYIEQYIEDAPFSIFSTIGYTEKPDVVAARLLEGRAAIVVDGTPMVLTAPMLFIENFQTTEDYYSRPYYMSLIRLLRYIAFFTTVFVPALYVAVTTFNQELIPTNLLFTMAAARESIPFPAIIEAFLMLAAFELLREAGIRLPQPIGQAMSIVGALVIGQATVSAGIVSAPMVIVVAITSVSIFAIPQLSEPASILRLIFLILAGTMGGYGIIIGTLCVLVHLASLKSFGFPFLSPLAPFETKDNKDSLFRFPLWLMISRPKGMAKDSKRKDFHIPPTRPSDFNSED